MGHFIMSFINNKIWGQNIIQLDKWSKYTEFERDGTFYYISKVYQEKIRKSQMFYKSFKFQKNV